MGSSPTRRIPPGSDAERRAAKELARELERRGRDVEVEAIDCWPRWAPAYAMCALLGIGGSVLSVYEAAPGAALALLALLLAWIDLSGMAVGVRRLMGRRASQNVVSPGDDDAEVFVAAVDTERFPARRLRWLLGAMALVVLCCTLRVIGLDGTAFTAVQFAPTVLLLLAVAWLLDEALPKPAPEAEPIELPEQAGWIVLTGGGRDGPRALRRRHPWLAG